MRDRLGDRVEIRENKGPRVLHAKVLIIRGPSNLAIVGFSNLTWPGLGCYKPGNIEASVLLESGPAFNDIVAWFEQVFSEKRRYLQIPDSMIRRAYPFTESVQRLVAEEEPHEQEEETGSSWEGTLSTASGGIEGLMQRVDVAMIDPPRQLRDYQQAILQTLDQSWEMQNFRELIVLPVGAGKTQIAAALIARRLSQPTTSMRILWLAHTLQLVEQAASVVLSQLSSSGINVPILFWFGNAKSTDEAQRLCRNDPCIAFATVQSLPSLRKELGRRTFDLVVVDEAHHIGASTWGTNIRGACRRGTGRLLGLTATPDRLDDVELGFNENFHHGSVTFRTLVEREILAVPNYQAVQTKGGQITGLRYARNEAMARKNFENGIGAFDKDWRNSFIAQDLAQRDSGQTLVFCATKDHADNLQRELIKVGLPEDRVRSVHSGRTLNERADALEWFRAQGSEPRFLLNCKLYIEGFDMTDVRTIVLARPTLSPTYWIQMIGRGVRRSNDHPSFDIIEYTDKYEQGQPWGALRASLYLLHDNGLEWWHELRDRWPDSINPRQINAWNKKTNDTHSNILSNLRLRER